MEHIASQSRPNFCQSTADSTSQLLNEIMPMIYKRFTDKTAEEWRQIYKVYDAPEGSALRTDNCLVAATARILDQARFGTSG